MSGYSKTLSISSSYHSCKQIDQNIKNMAEELNFSQYDRVMEQGLGLYKRLDDTLFSPDDTNSEVTVNQSIIASQNLDSRFLKDHTKSRLSYTPKKEKCKRKIVKAKKRTLGHIKNYRNNSIYKINFNKRDNSTQEKVEKLRHAIINKQYHYDQKKKVSKLTMPLHLKYLSVENFQNPIRSCRYFEYVFPLDAKLYCFGSENTRSLHENIGSFKRIYCVENLTLKKQIKYFIEERNPWLVGKNHEGILKTTSYFCDWLESLNNAKAKFFRDVLIQHKNKMHEYINKVMELNSCSTENHISHDNSEIIGRYKKLWIQKLDSNTKKWIKQRPYLVKTLRTNQENEVTEIDSLLLSYSMFDFLGYTPNVEDHYAGFTIMDGIAVTNFTEYFMDQSEQDWDVPNVAKPDKQFNGMTIRYDNKSKKIKTGMIFHEKWIINNYHYSRSYAVMYK